MDCNRDWTDPRAKGCQKEGVGPAFQDSVGGRHSHVRCRCSILQARVSGLAYTKYPGTDTRLLKGLARLHAHLTSLAWLSGGTEATEPR